MAILEIMLVFHDQMNHWQVVHLTQYHGLTPLICGNDIRPDSSILDVSYDGFYFKRFVSMQDFFTTDQIAWFDVYVIDAVVVFDFHDVYICIGFLDTDETIGDLISDSITARRTEVRFGLPNEMNESLLYRSWRTAVMA